MTRAVDGVAIEWGMRIPMRDGIALNALHYRPPAGAAPAPAIVSLTPYVAQSLHEQGLVFAARGYPFLAVDMRGRGDSGGAFDPGAPHGRDGHDICEWVAAQPWCDGRVAMWGGSIAGYVQWLTAAEAPPHLAAIAPAASPYRGLDTPMRNNIPGLHRLQWLSLIAGRASHEKVFADQAYWNRRFYEWHDQGQPFRHADRALGLPSAAWQQWMEHPHLDAYWAAQNPAAAGYARIGCPVLAITGIFDANQPGTLEHHRRHLAACPGASANTHLVIGPWDHAGTRRPAATVGGVALGPAAVIDLDALHGEWFDWRLRGGSRPHFLADRVTYYVLGADAWRHAPSLDAVTERHAPFALTRAPQDDGGTGLLSRDGPSDPAIASFVHDPCDLTDAALEAAAGRGALDHRWRLGARRGRQLVFESQPFKAATEFSGQFVLDAFLSIDRPDADFEACIYRVAVGGDALLLTSDLLRARHRTSLEEARLIDTTEPLLYRFNRFFFTACRFAAGERLRLVLGPLSSIYMQRNYHGVGPVADQGRAEAKPVTVKLFMSRTFPSVLRAPLAREDAR